MLVSNWKLDRTFLDGEVKRRSLRTITKHIDGQVIKLLPNNLGLVLEYDRKNINPLNTEVYRDSDEITMGGLNVYYADIYKGERARPLGIWVHNIEFMWRVSDHSIKDIVQLIYEKAEARVHSMMRRARYAEFFITELRTRYPEYSFIWEDNSADYDYTEVVIKSTINRRLIHLGNFKKTIKELDKQLKPLKINDWTFTSTSQEPLSKLYGISEHISE